MRPGAEISVGEDFPGGMPSLPQDSSLLGCLTPSSAVGGGGAPHYLGEAHLPGPAGSRYGVQDAEAAQAESLEKWVLAHCSLFCIHYF